ncbi:MAG: nucleotidyltransferase domain-containing protein [Candidatus Aenigmarchaeota archaeon]|nr:nucleotidyltransferase domain-containing protein [Candidatus Aenigmarchaeota archaeon]
MLLNNIHMRIFEEFARDYTVKLTGSQIAKKKNLNQKTVANTLKKFESQKFLKSTTQGKNKLYSLNLDDAQMSVQFISILEHLRTMDFYKKQPFMKEIASKIVPVCEGIVVIFGSYVKGTQKKDSDLDLFVVGSYKPDELDKISKAYKIEINVKSYPGTVFKKALKKKDPFLEEIMQNHIILNDIQSYVYNLMAY